MNESNIKLWLKVNILRKVQVDIIKLKSILNSVEIDIKGVGKIPLKEETASIIFKTLYDSIRKLGDIKWGLLGYEAQNHKISLDILKDFDIKNKFKLNILDRFHDIRNNASYRGFLVSLNQAEEIQDFWDSCGKQIMEILKKHLK